MAALCGLILLVSMQAVNEAASRAATRDRRPVEDARVARCLAQFDGNHDGMLDAGELRELLEDLDQDARQPLSTTEEIATDEVKKRIAGFKHIPRSESGVRGFRPRLLLGCVVDATEFAWVQDASNRLPKEAKPRILIVSHIEGRKLVSHSYCTFQTPRGSWFAYNPTRGSHQLMASQVPNAELWGRELVPSAARSWFEDAR